MYTIIVFYHIKGSTLFITSSNKFPPSAFPPSSDFQIHYYISIVCNYYNCLKEKLDDVL